jgi:hypothetical protein
MEISISIWRSDSGDSHSIDLFLDIYLETLSQVSELESSSNQGCSNRWSINGLPLGSFHVQVSTMSRVKRSKHSRSPMYAFPGEISSSESSSVVSDVSADCGVHPVSIK